MHPWPFCAFAQNSHRRTASAVSDWIKMRVGQAFWPKITVYRFFLSDEAALASIGGKGRSMLRTALALSVVAVLLATAGCTMCCHPCDYCGPVYEGQCGGACSGHSRVGSILSGGTPQTQMATETAVVRRQQTGQSISQTSLQDRIKHEVRPGDVPGSQKIVSVTDRVVGPSADSAASTELAADASPEPKPSQPVTSKRWTARRPTPETIR
jgi:hypothetical protein